MCVTNIYLDRYPDGREVESRKTSICRYGKPDFPCANVSTLKNPARKIKYGEPRTIDLLNRREIPSYTLPFATLSEPPFPPKFLGNTTKGFPITSEEAELECALGYKLGSKTFAAISYTISKDATSGEEACNASLLAEFGRKFQSNSQSKTSQAFKVTQEPLRSLKPPWGEEADEYEFVRVGRQGSNHFLESPVELSGHYEPPVKLSGHSRIYNRPWKCQIKVCKYHEVGWPTEKELDQHCKDKHSAPIFAIERDLYQYEANTRNRSIVSERQSPPAFPFEPQRKTARRLSLKDFQNEHIPTRVSRDKVSKYVKNRSSFRPYPPGFNKTSLSVFPSQATSIGIGTSHKLC